jgi:hypothetical protein
MTKELDQLNKLISDLHDIGFGEKDKLASHLRKTEVYIKKVFGITSEYFEQFCQISFLPKGVIYNTGHYKNQEAWDGGISDYNSLLECLVYEFEMEGLRSKNELEYPKQVTLVWLKKHVPIKFWISLVSLLVASFFTGVTASEYGITKKFSKAETTSAQNNEIKAQQVIPVDPANSARVH